MLYKSLLSCLVIVGRYDKKGINSVFFSCGRQINGSLRTVGTRTCNDRYPLVDHLGAELNAVKMLLMGQG